MAAAERYIALSDEPISSNSPQLIIDRDPEAQQPGPVNGVVIAVNARQVRNKRLWWWLGGGFATLVVAGLAVYAWGVPLIATGSINGATITVASAVMSSPGPDGVRLQSSVVLSGTGLFGASLSSFEASVGFQGEIFGTLAFPAVQVTGGEDTTVVMDSRLVVSNNDVFRKATSPILQGIGAQWQISGSTTVSAVGRTMTLQMKQVLNLPGLRLHHMTIDNVDILSGTKDVLKCSADNTFTSDSVVEIHDFGLQTFEVHPIMPDGSMDSIVIGYCTIANFQARKGLNSFKNVSVTMVKTPESVAAISHFMSVIAAPADQHVMIYGPINSTYPFLNGITTQTGLAKGLSAGIAANASISAASAMTGYDPLSGKPCGQPLDLGCLATLLHGSFSVMENVLSAGINLTDLSIDVNLDDRLDYNVSMEIIIPGMPPMVLPQSCMSQGKMLSNMYSTPGMWAPFDTKRDNDAWIALAPKLANENASYITSFLPAQPQIGQALDPSNPTPCSQALGLIVPFDCCFLSVFTAATCMYAQRGLDHLPTNLHANATMTVGEFSVNVSMVQKGVPAFFSKDMLDFNFYGLTLFDCRNITFAS